MGNSKTERTKRNRARKRARGGVPSTGVPPRVDNPTGVGAMVPRFDLGRDTLLGTAPAIRRNLSLVFTGSLSGAAGVYAEGVLILNSAYNGGTSAAGYAKYMAFYKKCFVVGATLIVRGVVIDNATTTALTCGVTLTDSASTLVSAVRAIENGQCDWTVVFNLPDRVTFAQSVDVAKFKRVPSLLSEDDYASLVTTDPTSIIDAHIWTQPNDAGTAISFKYTAEVLYDCVFTDPITFT